MPPTVGDTWRINLFRVDRLGTPPKETGSAWSPPLAPDYHTLAKFGELVFGDDKGVAPMKAMVAPASAPLHRMGKGLHLLPNMKGAPAEQKAAKVLLKAGPAGAKAPAPAPAPTK